MLNKGWRLIIIVLELLKHRLYSLMGEFIVSNFSIVLWSSKQQNWYISTSLCQCVQNNNAPRRPTRPFYCYWCIETLVRLVNWGVAYMVWYTTIKYVGFRPLQSGYNLHQPLSPQLIWFQPNPLTLIKPIQQRTTLLCVFIGVIVYYWSLSWYHDITRAIYAIYMCWIIRRGVDISGD
jgi:hypothetical protein